MIEAGGIGRAGRCGAAERLLRTLTRVTANWIDLETLVNLRDVGGMPTTDGRRIATGQLLRSDNLQSLTDSDIRSLLGLGLTDVIDLRSDLEVEQEGPGPLTREPGVAIHHYSMFKENLTDAETETELTEQINATLSAEEITAQALPWTEIIKPTIEVEDESASFYLSYLVDRPDSVVAALRSIANADGAALVHCAAGKDRTGWTIATLLTILGADRDTIMQEYLLSNAAAGSLRDWLQVKYGDKFDSDSALLGVDSSYLHTAWTSVDRNFGSFDGYLKAIGVGPDTQDAIRARLLG